MPVSHRRSFLQAAAAGTARLAPRSITNSLSTRLREWFRSDCEISTESSPPRRPAITSARRLRQRRREALERLVEQQQARADGERARQRDHLLLAARQQQRAALAHRMELGQHAVDEVEASSAGCSVREAQTGTRMFSSTVSSRHQAAVFRHVADAEAPRARAAAARSGPGRRTRCGPSTRRDGPSRVRISVVLPAPLRPTRPTIVPAGHLERQAAQDLHRLDRDVQGFDRQHRRQGGLFDTQRRR